MLVLTTFALEMCFASLDLDLQDRQTCYVRQYHRIWKGNQLSLTCLCIHMTFVTLFSCCALSVLHCALSNLFCALSDLLCALSGLLCALSILAWFLFVPYRFCLVPYQLRLVPYPLCFMGMSSKWACRAHGHVVACMLRRTNVLWYRHSQRV